MSNISDLLRKYEVTASGVSDFLARYYKPDRYTGRGDDYASMLLASYESDFRDRGVIMISHHDSVTGVIVSYYGQRNK